MKNVLLCVLLSTLVIAGCKKKDKAAASEKDLIVAKWDLQKIDYLSLKDGVKDYNGSSIFAPGSYAHFKADRTFILHIKEITENEFQDQTGTYVLTGKELTIVDPEDGSSEKFIIKTLDKKNLVFERIEEYEYEGSSYKDTDTFFLTR